jgi:hypothetical protein
MALIVADLSTELIEKLRPPASTTTAAEPICSRSEDDRAGTTLANTGVLDAGVAAFIQR